MDSVFIADRISLADATDLLALYGAAAGHEAAVRAEASRINGNLRKFCHWRQIERVVTALSSETSQGTVH